jgi:hypothetical protein
MVVYVQYVSFYEYLFPDESFLQAIQPYVYDILGVPHWGPVLHPRDMVSPNQTHRRSSNEATECNRQAETNLIRFAMKDAPK